MSSIFALSLLIGLFKKNFTFFLYGNIATEVEQKKGQQPLAAIALWLRFIFPRLLYLSNFFSFFTFCFLSLQQAQNVLRAGIGLGHGKRARLYQDLHLGKGGSFLGKVNVTD